MSNGNDRISPQDDGGEKNINSLLERASAEARRILRTVQATMGTTYCEEVQIHGLKQFAQQNDCWIEFVERSQALNVGLAMWLAKKQKASFYTKPIVLDCKTIGFGL